MKEGIEYIETALKRSLGSSPVLPYDILRRIAEFYHYRRFIDVKRELMERTRDIEMLVVGKPVPRIGKEIRKSRCRIIFPKQRRALWTFEDMFSKYLFETAWPIHQNRITIARAFTISKRQNRLTQVPVVGKRDIVPGCADDYTMYIYHMIAETTLRCWLPNRSVCVMFSSDVFADGERVLKALLA
jgi:hypothetical protein